ncbi:MAG: efflux RND transporter periplasmic adaptor subunit [Micavibrio aeruginosavorus]|uniref:Efflux RND transporter periplasmic adaptor subunit n=1 Tax=Micavibrio aeruginosavorus TaxID=349221 RepID=A0A7T5UHM4_9BACT|nr:MAG: efflux RND transporter periplasmic adaptor subunit [Micavibrio aeruginosavorus]
MRIITLFSVLVLLVMPLPSWAHGGEDHGEGAFAGGTAATGPVILSDESIKTLGIETAKAELKPLENAISMIATVGLLPERNAFVASRFTGQVSEIMVKLGEKVKKGQPLLKIQPTAVGANNVTLAAPIDGWLIRQDVVLGQTVTSETVVMEIGDTSQVLARGVLYETPDIAKIKIGQKIRFQADIDPERVYQGTVQRLDMGLEENDRTFKVHALIDNPESRLLPGLRGDLDVMVGGGDQDRLIIPRKALLESGGAFFIFVREEDKFERRNIVPGESSGDEIEIISGVFPDEDVVTQGQYQLQYIQPQTQDAPAANDKD